MSALLVRFSYNGVILSCMNATETFLAELDHRGNPLFPGATIIAEHDGLAVVDWLAHDTEDELTYHRRTLIDMRAPMPTMRPGILGDAEHVHGWLIRQTES